MAEEITIRDYERFEDKFMMTEILASRLKPRMERYLWKDPHNGSDGYRVRTCYFDSFLNGDYESKLAGAEKRQKVRLRIYDPASPTAIFELKEKIDSYERKRSLLVSRDVAESMLQGDFSWLDRQKNKFLSALFRELTFKTYRPKAIVEYNRTAFYLPENNTRITFDRNVTASEATYDLFSPHFVASPILRQGALIMEIKYTGFLLSTVKIAMGEMLLQPESISKYCLARQISKHGRN